MDLTKERFNAIRKAHVARILEEGEIPFCILKDSPKDTKITVLSLIASLIKRHPYIVSLINQGKIEAKRLFELNTIDKSFTFSLAPIIELIKEDLLTFDEARRINPDKADLFIDKKIINLFKNKKMTILEFNEMPEDKIKDLIKGKTNDNVISLDAREKR